MSRTKLLQVTRAVEKEVRGGNGSNHNRGSKFRNGLQPYGSHGPKKDGSDWVMIRGRDSSNSGGMKSGAGGLRNDKQAQSD
ncbi:hypothetical protein L195_g062662, partial [Trifolium pratense]